VDVRIPRGLSVHRKGASEEEFEAQSADALVSTIRLSSGVLLDELPLAINATKEGLDQREELFLVELRCSYNAISLA
jgi:hypothetical protein